MLHYPIKLYYKDINDFHGFDLEEGQGHSSQTNPMTVYSEIDDSFPDDGYIKDNGDSLVDSQIK